MGTKRTRKNYLKYIAAALAVVILITAALLLLETWEKNRGRFEAFETEHDVVEYEGKEYVKKDGIETFLVIGLDKYKDAMTSDSHSGGGVQADFLMLFVFDNNAKKTTAVQIDRDTIANVSRLDVGGNKIGTDKKQIALAYNFAYETNGGKNCRNTADSVSDLLLGVKIDHYISLTMDSVIELNDLVGGVELTVLNDFTGIDDTLVAGETVTLTGEHALTYVRSRYGLEDSTNASRMERQRQYINALTDRVKVCASSDEEFILRAADSLKPYLEYDSTDYRLREFAERFDEYEFTGNRQLDGERNIVDGYVEFHPSESSVYSLVLDLFYVQK